MQVTGAASRPGPASGDEGFTVVELSIVMAIALIVMSSLLGLLVSQSNASARMEKFVDNQEQTRLAMVALQRDLRSAEAVLPVPAGVDAASQVELLVYADPTATTPTTVRWRVTPEHVLVREVVTAEQVMTTFALRGIANQASDVPLLSYYGRNSDVPFPRIGAGPTIAICTVRVGIDLLAAPIAGPAPTRLISDVQLRNRILDEGRLC